MENSHQTLGENRIEIVRLLGPKMAFFSAMTGCVGCVGCVGCAGCGAA